jgi:hypothetical protein
MLSAGVAFPQQFWRSLCLHGDIRNPKNESQTSGLWGNSSESNAPGKCRVKLLPVTRRHEKSRSGERCGFPKDR